MGLAPQFGLNDYLLALPITLLTLFAIGILLIDLMLPAEEKWVNAVTALVGVLFAAKAVYNLQAWMQASGVPRISGFMGTVLVDRFSIYFFYLFLGGTAISILMSMRYMKTEHENHGEYYTLMLLSVVGMMSMAAGFDIVLIFIGLELMAISTSSSPCWIAPRRACWLRRLWSQRVLFSTVPRPVELRRSPPPVGCGRFVRCDSRAAQESGKTAWDTGRSKRP